MSGSVAPDPAQPISFVFETVTPEAAAALLAVQRSGAERLEAVVRGYRDAMAGGLWVLNGMPIIVSRSGALLDGVQRLLACADAGVAFPTAVARGVDDAAVDTIDLHRRRTFSGLVGSAGGQQARARMAVILCLARYDHLVLGRPPAPAPSWPWMEGIVRANPSLAHAFEASRLLAGSPLPEPVRSAILHMGHAVDRAKTERLLAALAHPERVARGEPGAVLRAELDRAAEMRTLSTNMAMALAIQALNALLRHETPRRLNWSATDALPRLIGYQGLATGGPEHDATPRAEVSFERIGPDLAGRYLASAAPGRRLIKTHVAALARDISEGRWMQNAQPICFSASGQLMNGQHRLVAVVASGGTIEVPVVRGLPEAAAATYDIQARRAPAGADDAATFGDQALAGAMAHLLWRNEIWRNDPARQEEAAGALRERRATASEMRQVLRDHPRLLGLRGLARRLVAFGRASVLGYGAYIIERDRADLAGAFFAALETGAGLAPGDPMLSLRESLGQMRREHASQEAQLAALLAGWERFKQGPGEAAPRAVEPPELRRRMRHQALATGFSGFALRENDTQMLLREAARVAAEGVGAGYAAILEHDRATDTLLLRAGIGWQPGAVGRTRLRRGASSPAGYCLATGQATICNDLTAEARFATPPLLAEHGIQCEVNVLIGDADAPFGVLEVSDSRPGSFSEADLRFLQGLANILALAIERGLGAARLATLRGEIGQRSRAGLQLAHSMLALQAHEAEAGAARALLERSARRILTLAVVVGRVQNGHAPDAVEMNSYVAELLEALRDGRFGFPPARPLTLEAGVPVRWPPERAQLLGIVLGEVLAAAMAPGRATVGLHAPAPLRLHFTAQADRAILEIEAERAPEPQLRLVPQGRGMATRVRRPEPAQAEEADSGSFDLRMASALMRERGGTLAIERQDGVLRVLLEFPSPPPAA